MRDSEFLVGLPFARSRNFNGIDNAANEFGENRSGKMKRCENTAFLDGKLTTPFGYAALPFTRHEDGTSRCFGIVPSVDKGKFYTFFSKHVTGTTLSSDTSYCNLLTMATTDLDTNNPKKNVCGVNLKNRTIVCDGGSIRKYYQASIYSNLVYIPPAGVAAEGDAGVLNGTYSYRATLCDDSGNETGGGASVSITVTDKKVTVTFDLSSYNDANIGFTSVKLYRTEANGSTYYYLGDTNGKKTIAAGTDSYVFTDNAAFDYTDSGIVENPQLDNDDPVNLTAADYLLVYNDRLIVWGTTEGSTYYPYRMRWCRISEVDGVIQTNIYSFHADDYKDFNKHNGDPVIGGCVLGGRLFTFKGDETWESIPTTADPEAYGIWGMHNQVDTEYGFYHHSIANIGGPAIGLTRDGVCIFNGSGFTLISDPISEILKRAIFPEVNSGCFDLAEGRYYLSVCDGGLAGTYGRPVSTTYLYQNAKRNATLVYDVSQKSWEYHPLVFNQIYTTLEDSQNKPKIFCGGSISDVNVMIGNYEFSGPSYCALAVVTNATSITDTSFSGADDMFNDRRIAMPICYDTESSSIIFTDYVSRVSDNEVTGTTAVMALEDTIPMKHAYRAWYVVNVAYGVTAASGNTDRLTDNGNNAFLASCLTGCSCAFASSEKVYNNLRNGAEVLTISSLNFGGGAFDNIKNYVLFPFRYIDSQSPDFYSTHYEPRVMIYTVPFGIEEYHYLKLFRYLRMYAKGDCEIRVRVFKDGDDASAQTVTAITLSDEDVFKHKISALAGHSGRFVRFELSMPRGYGEFEINEIAAGYRRKTAFRAD